MRPLLPLLLISLAACVAPSEPVSGGRFELLVLGVAQDGGLPHVGCLRPCCETARDEGREYYPACLAVHDRETGAVCLFEATPRIEPQLALLERLTGRPRDDSGPRANPVDAVLLTHAHIGHYLGLAQFGREVSSTRGLPVFLGERFAEFLGSNAPWSQLVKLGQLELHPISPGASFEPIAGLRVHALPVPHRDEFSNTFAYRIEGPNRTVLFVPDVDAWTDRPGLLDELLVDVDVAYLDATFYDGSELPGRDLSKIRHPFVLDTAERLSDMAWETPGRIRFIHLNHSNPLLGDQDLVDALERRGFRLARLGERIDL